MTFVVGEGSEATFTVREQMVRLPLPSDAVVRTSAISGEVHLDGRPSVIEIDLHQLNSDQALRDRYIRGRMFPDDPIAVVTVDDVGPHPEGFAEGEVVTGQTPARFNIRGIEVPLTFDLEARDDGDVIFILARTSFTWADLEIPAPTVRIAVSIEDEVKVEVLLAVRPEISS